MDCTRDDDGPVVAERSQWQCLYLERSGFAQGSQYLGDILTWETTQSDIVRFSTNHDMATHSMAKRRLLETFSHGLLYNCQHSYFREVEEGNFVNVDRASRLCPNCQYSTNHNMDRGAIHVLV